MPQKRKGKLKAKAEASMCVPIKCATIKIVKLKTVGLSHHYQQNFCCFFRLMNLCNLKAVLGKSKRKFATVHRSIDVNA